MSSTEEKVEDLGSEVELEQRLIQQGKSNYSLEGDKLLEFVEKRLEAARDRERRAMDRELKRIEIEVNAEAQRLRRELARAEASSTQSSFVEPKREEPEYRHPKLDTPKFKNSQEVPEYFDLFDAVMDQNAVPKEHWHTTFRTAVVGTKLYDFVVDFERYDTVKSEALRAYGETASSVWRSTLSMHQDSETFREYGVRTARVVARWAKLALDPAEEQSAQSVLQAIVRQVITEASPNELTSYLIRNCQGKYDFEHFLEVGSTYQAAPSSRKHHTETNGSKPKESTTTAGCWHVGIEETERQLRSTPAAERVNVVMRGRLCRNCLKSGHMARYCHSRKECEKCGRRHHILLHGLVDLPIASGPEGAPAGGIKSYMKHQCAVDNRSTVHLMTAIAETKGEARCAKVQAFIDTGAQASFISTALVKAIKPRKVGVERLRTCAFGGHTEEGVLNLYELTVTGKDGRDVVMRAYEKPELECNNTIQLVDTVTIELWQSRGVELSDQPTVDVPDEVHIMMGADCASEILLQKFEFQGDYVWRTELGWVLCGQSLSIVPGDPAAREPTNAMSVGVVSEIQRLWEFEEPLVTTQKGPEFPLEKTDDGYEAGLLWRSEERPCDNRYQAKAMADQLAKRLTAKGTRQAYEDVLIKEYSSLNAIELEPEPETPGYYLPHHAVFRSDATTTKTRVVFNASSSAPGKSSLNDCVDAGPSLLPDLCGMLLRVREYESAFQADIGKAFFMISIQERDRPYLRFYWPDENDELKVWRLRKLPFGVNCSPYVLTAVLQHHLNAITSAASEAEKLFLELLLASLYVDDCVSSVPNSSDAEKFQEHSINALQSAGMDLRKWRGNTIACSPEAGSKVLGMAWSTEEDTLTVAAVSDMKRPSTRTRRKLLTCVASIYDPLGLASPTVLPGKMLLQRCWKLGG